MYGWLVLMRGKQIVIIHNEHSYLAHLVPFPIPQCSTICTILHDRAAAAHSVSVMRDVTPMRICFFLSFSLERVRTWIVCVKAIRINKQTLFTLRSSVLAVCFAQNKFKVRPCHRRRHAYTIPIIHFAIWQLAAITKNRCNLRMEHHCSMLMAWSTQRLLTSQRCCVPSISLEEHIIGWRVCPHLRQPLAECVKQWQHLLLIQTVETNRIRMYIYSVIIGYHRIPEMLRPVAPADVGECGGRYFIVREESPTKNSC